MNIDYNIEEIFPTPVFKTNIPVELSSISNFLLYQETTTGVDSQNYGERSKNSYILDTPECRELHDYILQVVTFFGKNVMYYEYDEYKFSQSWVSYKYPNQHHHRHIHPNSLISGVFYFGAMDNNIPSIFFHRESSSPLLRPRMRQDLMDSQFSQPTFEVKPEPGLMVLFPSYLEHSVSPNKTNFVRSSLAFNVVPKKGFGEEETLTELRF